MSMPTTSTAASLDVRRARRGLVAVFLTHSILRTSWLAYIPSIKGDLDLSTGTLGTVLLGAPVGSVIAMLLSGPVIRRLGNRRTTMISLVGYAILVPTLALASTPWELFGALLVWGGFQAALDVAMNAQGVTLEAAFRRPIMSGLHGMWSTGGFTGAAAGAAAVGAHVPLLVQSSILGALGLVLGGLMARRLLPDPSAESHPTTQQPTKGLTSTLKDRTILALSALAVMCMLCEGAVADWSAVQLHSLADSNDTTAGLGFAAFSAVMLALRFSGDRLTARFSTRKIISRLNLVAAAAMAAGLLSGHVVPTLVGYALLGLGLALIAPTVFAAGGRIPGVHPGTGVAAVAALGWLGYVCGPPLIGHLAEWTSVTTAMFLVPALCLVMGVTAQFTRALDRPAPMAGQPSEEGIAASR